MTVSRRLFGLALAAGLLLPAAAPAANVTRLVDEAIDAGLRKQGLAASPQASDAEFLRRVYLDIAGVIPTAEQAAAFLDSKDPAKRARLIDELLASERYGERQADVWEAMLLPRSSDNRRIPRDGFRKWLLESFNKNTPWDELVRDLLTADGPLDEKPQITYFLTNQTPDKVVDSVSKLFLGVQLQCAQCHNHPFYEWKQDDYWATAAFFMKVRQGGGRFNNKNPNANPEISESANVRGRRPNLPESAKMVPARYPAGGLAKLDEKEPYRPAFAAWLTAKDNRFFARAMVNRTWAQLFGRGIMNPVDDMQEGNAASHPELLDKLAGQFATDFDLKALIRGIANSRAYQRSSVPTAGNQKDTVYLSHFPVQVLSAEQLYDSLTAVLGPPPGRERGRQNVPPQLRGQNNPKALFVFFFQGDEVFDPTKYEAGIPQVLRLMNGPRFQAGLNRKAAEGRGKLKPEEVVEHLYLSTLSRRPTPAENARLMKYVASERDQTAAYGDVLWAILNSSEFTMNH